MYNTKMVIKVAIVGAGASARFLAKTLKASSQKSSTEVHITVIQPNTFASLPYYQTLVLTQRETLSGNSTFEPVEGADETVYGVAVSASDGLLKVQPLDTAGGGVDPNATPVEVPFDVLVAATGSKNPVIVENPGQSFADRQAEIDAVSKALLRNGSNVVIAGGGATGVELAGDVIEVLPEESRKGKVTLICSGERLIADQERNYSEKSYQMLEQLGVSVIFNDRVTSHSDTTVAKEGESFQLELKSGKTLPCDVYVAAFNQGPNTSWLTTAPDSTGDEGGLPSTIVNSRGQVLVNEFMQSPHYEKLYAMGATTDRQEAALTMNVEEQAKTIAANILAPESTKQPEGVKRPPFQSVGNETFGMLIPENMPIPSFMATFCCEWCGFPVNLLCPCFCCAVACGPVDPMTCGYCCGAPEGKGITNTRKALKDMNMVAKHVGYNNLGDAPTTAPMNR